MEVYSEHSNGLNCPDETSIIRPNSSPVDYGATQGYIVRILDGKKREATGKCTYLSERKREEINTFKNDGDVSQKNQTMFFQIYLE